MTQLDPMSSFVMITGMNFRMLHSQSGKEDFGKLVMLSKAFSRFRDTPKRRVHIHICQSRKSGG